MELNWTTFILEILNFLVLVWLLQRLFYRPVREMMEKRRKSIEERLEHSRVIQGKAEMLQRQYENRLQDWEGERQEARSQLKAEMEAERQKSLRVLQEEIAAERKRQEVLAERKMKEQGERNELRALKLGARFVSKVLQDVRTAELEARLVGLLLRQLDELPGEQVRALAAIHEHDRQRPIKIVSAYPLNTRQCQELEVCLHRLLSEQPSVNFGVDADLIAGLRITIGPWVIGANLQDELKTFAEMAHRR